MKNSNYIFLGVSISYFIITLIQLLSANALSANVYITVAWVSLELTLFELLKTIVNAYIASIKKHCNLCSEYLSLLKRNRDALKNNAEFTTLTQNYNTKIEDVQNDLKIKNSGKRIILAKSLLSALTVLQMVFCTVQFIIIPLKAIPYDALTNKTINILTLLSFSFMFLSYFISSLIQNGEQQQQEKLDIEKDISNHYLDIIETIGKQNMIIKKEDKE